MDSTIPDSKSSNLHLTHATVAEYAQICNDTAELWKDSLNASEYLAEQLYLQESPLAKNGGMTTWILVDKNSPIDQRQVLCSCESYRKRSLISDINGAVANVVVHGIASVFCPRAYRSRGYASRMMRDLVKELYFWQSEYGKCVGSILYSDIGKDFYHKLGWIPNTTNNEVILLPSELSAPSSSKSIRIEDIGGLCRQDEVLVRQMMALSSLSSTECRVVVLPDHDHMLWHIMKEEFACQIWFDKVPNAKGAIAGRVGSRVWVIWTHRYYTHPSESLVNDNTLYILRLVFEDSSAPYKGTNEYNEQVENLQAVLRAAQDEAQKWKLGQVKLWAPSPAVEEIIKESGLEHSIEERTESAIASGLWYGLTWEERTARRWIGNEHYAWC